MDIRPILLLAALLASTATLAQAYRWVDENGVVHYSDRPQPGAEEIQLPKSNTTTVRRYQDDEPEAPPPPAAPVGYQSLAISSPAAEETLWNIEGVLDVSLSVSPALMPGHRVRVYFDGEPRVVFGRTFQINEVWRGMHNLQAEVIDETGKLMIRSLPVRFYVQQSTVNF